VVNRVRVDNERLYLLGQALPVGWGGPGRTGGEAQMTDDDRRERDIDAALDTAAACRGEASRIRQTRMFPEYAKWLEENAKAAEKWAAKR
jgi:hypothetical protein